MQVKTSTRFRMNILKMFEVQRMFLSEVIIFAFVQYAIPLTNGKGSVSWGIIATLFSISLSTLFFSNGEKERFPRAFYCSAIPIIIAFTWLCHMPSFEIILLFVFSYWRLKVFYSEECVEDPENFFSSRLLTTILVFVFMYFVGYITGMLTRNLLIIFPFLQFLLFGYGTFFKRFIQNKHIDKKSFFNFGSYLFSIPVLFALVITFIISTIKHGLSVVFDKFFWFFVNLISPILDFFINILHVNFLKNGNRQGVQEVKSEDISDKVNGNGDMLLQKHQHENIYIMIGIVIIVVIVVIWFILHIKKGKFKKEDIGYEHHRSVFYNILDTKNRKGKHTSYYSKSTQQIRKYVLELEHFAAKHQLEREGQESVRDWLERLNIKPAKKWLSIYENVRYGSVYVSQLDVIYFGKELKEIKNCIKSFHKNK